MIYQSKSLGDKAYLNDQPVDLMECGAKVYVLATEESKRSIPRGPSSLRPGDKKAYGKMSTKE
jgi:hypothetical protein